MTVRPWLHAVLLQGIACLLLLVPASVWSADPLHVVTDATWKYVFAEEPDWPSVEFDDAAWPTVEAPSAGLCPPGDIGTPIPGSTAQPIWGQNPEEFQTIFTRKTFTLEQARTATIQTIVDDEFELYVNGQLIRHEFGGVWVDQVVLPPGPNVLAIKGIDFGGCQFILAELAVEGPLFLVTTTADSGPGSLRQAVLDANANEEAPSRIAFNIPTADPGFDGQVFTIAPATPIPVVEQDTAIDGFTQTTFTGDTNAFGPEVVLHGGQVEGGSGLELGGDRNVVQGLVINGFTEGAGLLVARPAGPSSSQNQLLDSYLGTDPTGTEAVPNGEGITLMGLASPEAQARGTVIRGNLIAGNTGAGIRLCDAAETEVFGNRIGTDRDGINPLGNGGHGISLECVGAPRTQIAENTIAFNGGDGVRDAPDYDDESTLTPDGHQGMAIRRNAVVGNGGLGINLIPPAAGPTDGVTPNDACDADVGANQLQNFPELTLAASDGQTMVVTGTLDGAPSQSFEIELFANVAADPSGFGEGQIFLGTVTATTDASCRGTFTAGFFTGTVGLMLTATATDAAGNTSEFSTALPVLPSVTSCQGGPSHLRGRVTTADEATGRPSVTVTLFRVDDACSQTTTTQAFGGYAFPNLREGTYIVFPSATECTFVPPSQTVGLFGGNARLNFAANCP